MTQALLIKNIFSVGNDCNYVLTHVESIAAEIPLHLWPFITFMRALNEVKFACFTTDYLDPNYREVIGEFDKCVKELQSKFKISIINKWHILTVHVPQWIDHFQKPLGRYGEHELEVLHQRYKEVRQKRFIVKNKKNSSYKDLFYRCGLTFKADST